MNTEKYVLASKAISLIYRANPFLKDGYLLKMESL